MITSSSKEPVELLTKDPLPPEPASRRRWPRLTENARRQVLQVGNAGDEAVQVRGPSSAIDVAVDRLRAAYRDAGLAPIRPAGAGTARILADIKLEIAPLRLPVELERFWQLVDPRTITVAPYPHPTDADFALDSWKSHRDEFPGMTPRLLFPLAYESHGFLLVELSDGDSQGGAVLEWGYAGSPFYLRFAAVSAYVELLATMIECDEFTRHEGENRSWIEFDPERRWEGAQAARLTAAQPLPGLGAAREIDEDVRHWPAHWLASNGLNAETSSPRGASSTVADLLFGAAAGSAVSGTIQARVTSLAGSGAGCRVAVDDGTGVLDLWCPAAVCTYGPGIRREFEFDVVVQPNSAVVPDWGPEHRQVQDRALAHDLEGAQSAAMHLYAKAFQSAAQAEATAIRPLD